MHETALRRAVAEVARLLHERGWVANHDGNVSVRIGPGRVVCTPTAVSKRVIVPEMLLVVDDEGRMVAGRGRPFSELNLHMAVYRNRPDAVAALTPFLPEHDAVLLASHGTLAWGDDPEQAFLRTELVEHLSRILLLALPLGGAAAVPASVVPKLLDARTKAGLGPAGRSGKR